MKTWLSIILFCSSAVAQNKGTPIVTTGAPAPMLYDAGDPITLGYPCDTNHLALPFYNLNAGIARPLWLCSGTAWLQATFSVPGTTVSIGGATLVVGATTSGTGAVVGATVGQVCLATPSDGTFISGVVTTCSITSAGVATVTLQGIVAGIPAAKTYNVRVLP